MPNGHDRNLVRLMLALEGFRALHGHWPDKVRLDQGYIDNFRAILTEDGYQQLISKLELVADSRPGIRAEDADGASFTYGVDAKPEKPMDRNAAEWLGRLARKPHNDEPF